MEGEKKRLMDMLSAHDPTCAKRFKEMTTEAPLDQGEDLLDWLCKSDFTQPMTKIYQPTLPYVLRQFALIFSRDRCQGEDLSGRNAALPSSRRPDDFLDLEATSVPAEPRLGPEQLRLRILRPGRQDGG